MADMGICGERRVLVRTEDVVRSGDYYYFVALELNALCRIGIKYGTIEVVDSIPGEGLYSERVCSKIYALEDQLLFLPMNGEKIWVYKIGKAQWRSIELENSALTGMKMMQAVKHGNRIYLIGCFYPAIVVWDSGTGRIDYIREPYGIMKDLQAREKINYFRCDYALKEDVLYLASCLTNAVLKLNLTSHRWEFVRVGKSGNQYAGITRDKECFWLAPRTGNCLVRWDGYDSFREYAIEDEQIKGFFRFTGAVMRGDTVIFPAKDGRVTYEIQNGDSSALKRRSHNYLFYKVTEDGETISGTPDGVIRIESALGEVFKIKCEIPVTEIRGKLDNDGSRLKEYFLKREYITEENPMVSIKEFCMYLTSDTYRDKQILGDYSMAGKSIWSAVKTHSGRIK